MKRHYVYRIDFLPNNREAKAGLGKGCLRCGYNVFEAEKLIAAGRVTIIFYHTDVKYYIIKVIKLNVK